MNLWENRLRNWVPRRPSTKLKSRLFPPRSPGQSEVMGQIGWGWLAPVTVLLLLAALGLSQSTSPPTRRAAADSPRLLASVAGSNEPGTVFGYHRHDGERNGLPAAIFEWTNAQRSSSSMDFFLLLNTNTIRQ